MILASNRERTYLHILLQRADGSPASETVALCGSKIGKGRHGAALGIWLLEDPTAWDGIKLCRKCKFMAKGRHHIINLCPECFFSGKITITEPDGELMTLCDECKGIPTGINPFASGHLTPRQAIKKV